ncbi:MAG: hypothetical protein JRE23_17070 [Deltaproteobacteria bacterium]|nr:hypothetical protein [Deltaproteobacteria bacterium]
MEKVHIQVQTGTYSDINLTMEPGHKVFDVAQKLSIAYNACVTVEMYARIRRVYDKGEMVSDHSDLTSFYTNMSGQELHEWGMLGD